MGLVYAFKIPSDAPSCAAEQYLFPIHSSTLDTDNPFTVLLSFSQAAVLETEM